MRTLKTVTPYAIPVALLMLSIAFAAPAANAERPGYTSFEVRFAYDPSDSAREIYQDLNHKAYRVCNNSSSTRSIRYNIHAKECKAEVVDKVVQAIGRTDLAALHYRDRMTVVAAK